MPKFKVDLHSHCQGDPVDPLKDSIREHLDAAVERGMDAIAITWHTKIFDQPEWIAYAAERGLLLIPGAEINLNGKHHTLVLNVQPGDIGGAASVEELSDLRARKGEEILVIAPHPYYLMGSCLGGVIDRHPGLFDAVEWCHLHCKAVPGKINPNERARRWADKHGKPMVQTSDAHAARMVGRWYSTVEAEACTTAGLFSAIRAGRIEFEPESITLGTTVRKVGKVAMDYAKGAVGVGSVANERRMMREHAGSPSKDRPVRDVDAVNS